MTSTHTVLTAGRKAGLFFIFFNILIITEFLPVVVYCAGFSLNQSKPDQHGSPYQCDSDLSN